MRSRPNLRGMRAVHVTLAATALAVPASAVALTAATAAPADQPDQQALGLQISPSRIPLGGEFTATGVAPAADAGLRVLLQAAPAGSAAWRPVAATSVGPQGRFRLRATLRRSGVVRVVASPAPAAAAVARPADLAGALSGLTAQIAPITASSAATTTAAATAPAARTATGGGAASSPARPVIVTSRLRVDAGEHDILAGAGLAVRGVLLPAQPGRLVALEARSGHGWSTVARARTGRAGGFRLSYVPAGLAGQSLLVRFAGDRDNARSVERAGALIVFEPTVASWYEDGGTTACGFHAGLGVANRTLPCGTRVRLRYGGREVTAVVDDRGPFVGGRDWDLNQSTAAALGFAGVGTVWASVS